MPEAIEKKQPMKQILKDKFGEIIITKLDTYVEPHKAVKEARGDVRLQNNYNFGDLSYEENEDEEEDEKEGIIPEKLNESDEDGYKAIINEKKRKVKKSSNLGKIWMIY